MTFTSVDHIVLACPDLERAERVFTDRLGAACRGGGSHDGIGTRNRILPLGESYLEFVTIDDSAAAQQHPFGRLVLDAIDRKALFAGWVTAGEVRGDDRARVQRAGVSVYLEGCLRAIDRPDLPIRLARPAEQAFPGDTPAPRALVELEVCGPSDPEPGNGPTRIVHRRTAQSEIRSCTILNHAGDRVTIDQTWAVR